MRTYTIQQIKNYGRRVGLLFAATLMVHSGGMAIAQSITTQDVKDINNARPWYDPNFGGCPTGTSNDTTLVGNDNVEKAYNFLVGKGLKDFQAAGIIGNLMQESGPGLNPKADQKNGPGRGIAQWEEGARWENLKKWVSNPSNFSDNRIRDPESLEGQLAFLWHEMTEVSGWKETLPAVKGTTTVEQATVAFEEKFEKASTPNMPNRLKNARQVLKTYGGGAAETDPGTSETVSSCPSVGDNSQFIDGFTIYNQCDRAWKNKPYGSSTVCEAGCGPSAMAMIVTALTGKRVTPPEAASVATAEGMYIPNVGSSWDIGTKLAKRYGLKSKFIGANASKINDTLKNGGLVLISGSGPSPFTSGGHYLVIRAVTAEGKWKVGDSGHSNTSDKDWDPQTLLRSANDGSAYAIYK
ncbi:MAG TPA: phage tail tip lysozyme [Candidatus Saccharimonadales bacterium]|nr:phage tail tip lysozyme [Candidatus Saccharimonadales bacterium]